MYLKNHHEQSGCRIPIGLTGLNRAFFGGFLFAGILLSISAHSLQTPASTAAAPPSYSKPDKPPVEDPEVKLGRENAEENDKQVKLITTAAIVERVNRIGQELADVANKVPIPALWGSSVLKPFHYTFKVVDDKDVNAYSLPGGFIYVNKGLLDYVHSDDELAGVLAHEITHANHHHMMKLIREQSKINSSLLPLLLAVLIAHPGGTQGTAQALMASQLYTVAKLNSFGVDAEKDADHGGMMLMTHTHYNPVGLYSFMLRLAVDERNKSRGELGIYRTHPPGEERAQAARELLAELHIPLNLIEVDPTLQATVTTIKDTTTGADLAEIHMRGVVMCRLAAGAGLTLKERADRLAKKLNNWLDSRLQPFEIKPNQDQTRVMIRGVSVLTEADAAAQNKTITALAHDLAAAVMIINQKQQLDRDF